MDRETKTFFVCMLMVGLLFGATGQLLLKLGLLNTTPLLELFILLGVALYGLSTVIYLYILSRTHLSWVYSLGGLSYVFATILAVFVLDEPTSLARWLGVAVIAIGCILIGLS